MARKKHKHKKNSHGQTKLKKQQGAFHDDLTRNKNIFIRLFSHLNFSVLLTITIAFTVVFYQGGLLQYAIWAGFVTFLLVELGTV